MASSNIPVPRIFRQTTFKCCICLGFLDEAALGSEVSTSLQGSGNQEGSNSLPGPSNGMRNSSGGGGPKKDDPSVTTATACGHLFHEVCIKTWLVGHSNRTCPACTKAVALKKAIRLYPSMSDSKAELIKKEDYDRLREAYDNVQDSNNVKDVQITSLESDTNPRVVDLQQFIQTHLDNSEEVNSQKDEEIRTLKRALEAEQMKNAASPACERCSGCKRPRRE